MAFVGRAPSQSVVESNGTTRSTGDPLLEVEDLHVRLRTRAREVHAVCGLSYSVRSRSTLAIIGESGSGKTVSARAVMGLLPPRTSTVTGSIRFDGTELVGLPEREMRQRRGRDMAMVFQNPERSLNPTMRIGSQVTEAMRNHLQLDKNQARDRAIELFRLVRIPSPERRFHEYPHQLSGGMRQRVMIAIALAARPALIIADEPTTALDPTVQAEVLGLLLDIREQYKTAILLITHDMGVVAEVADRVVVMYAGTVAEEGDVLDVFERPTHPYTAGLLASIPRPGRRRQEERLPSIPGRVPAPGALRTGCPFAPRCPKADTTCREQRPALEVTAGRHAAACFHPMTDSERAGSRKPLQDQGVSAPGGQPTGTAP